MIAHKRIRVVNSKVEEGPLTYPRTGANSKAQGWTDIRAVDIPPEAIIRTELVIAKGKTASAILADLVKQYGGHWLVCNASYFNDKTGDLIGRTYVNGKAIFPDIAGKTEHRPHFYRKNGRFGIGRQNNPTELEWGVVGVPTLSAGGRAIDPPHPEEKNPSNVSNTHPRMIAGIKADGTLGLILVDGRGPYDKGLTSKEASIMTTHYGYADSINLDGGGSATLATNNRQLLDTLEIDKINKKRNYHVADMSANYVQRVIHHAIAIQLDPDKLFPFYRQDHIPQNTSSNRRPGHAMSATTLTIHNTGNPSSTASNERAWLTNPKNIATASYHIVVDENEAIECIPLNESAWHAGDGTHGPGNRTSLSIEICESGNYVKTLENAVELVASMLKERGWGVDRLRRHYDWSGKICPRLMYDGGSWAGWAEFLVKVEAKLAPALDSPAAVSDQVDLIVNGRKLEQKGAIKDGVTTVPVRAMAEALGAAVEWNGESRAVIITK